MRRLLVTGGAGFIGANFVRYWRSRHPGDRLVVLDKLTYAGNRANLGSTLDDEQGRFVQGDINDTSRVIDLLGDERIDTLVHFAAESHVDRSIAAPDAFIEANVLGTHSLLKACQEVWLQQGRATGSHRFHHVSTDEVYGSLSAGDAAFTEETPYAPNSPYSASKAASDFLVRSYHHTYGLDVTTSNCSNNYGPYHFPEKLIPLTLLNALHGDALPVYGDGSNIRDWLYVEDHARGIEQVLDRGRIGDTYNIGGGNEWANIDIVRLICDRLDIRFAGDPRLGERFPDCPATSRGESCRSLIRFVGDRAGHDFRYAIDQRKLTAETGFEPGTDFPTGIDRTIDWYLDNEDWWRAILDGSYRIQTPDLPAVRRAA